MPREPRTAFVFAGGGSLGAVEVGMLEALLAAGVRADLTVGSSVGAVNALYFAADPSPDGVRRLAAVWRGVRRKEVFPVAPLRAVLALLAATPSLVDPGALRRLLERRLPLGRLEDAHIPCCVVATDLLSGREVRLTRGPTVDALLASAAIPAVFPPVLWQDQALIDGGVAANTPVSVAIDLGAERVVVLPTGTSCALEGVPSGALELAIHALNLLIARQLVVDVERFGSRVEIAVVPPLCPVKVSPHDFSQADELIQRAAKDTRQWLAAGGLARRDVPHELVPHEHGAAL
jgi:NTE family protein